MSMFTGFSEDELIKIKHNANPTTEENTNIVTMKKISKLGSKYKLPRPKVIDLDKVNDDPIDFNFDKCKLSIKLPVSPETDQINNNFNSEEQSEIMEKESNHIDNTADNDFDNDTNIERRESEISMESNVLEDSQTYNESIGDEHQKEKIEDLQFRQKLIEEQNKRRKEMLAKALADRTKQTAEEVLKLEKIKKELQVLDGQFSQDVAMLRKKIDQACHSYADAEKHYLKIEKEFLQAKINMQKEKEKKELLTEHLCALITHNETRKAQKLETLMLQLASESDEDVDPHIVDGVDVRTGKFVEMPL